MQLRDHRSKAPGHCRARRYCWLTLSGSRRSGSTLFRAAIRLPSNHQTAAKHPLSSYFCSTPKQVEYGTIGRRVTQARCSIGELVITCAQCRRTKRLRDNYWDWVPEFLRNPPTCVSYGICQECLLLYCPDSKP